MTGAWLRLSWFRWSDCLIDFGRELYIPWQMNQGKLLYKDLYFYYGPLVKYFHAFLFKILSPSLVVIVGINFIVLLLTVYLIFILFKFYKGYWAGMVAVFVFLGIFAFGRYTATGNYNYICPYAHELVYGFTLSLLGLLITGFWLKNRKNIYLAIVGLLTGLIFLTKIEVFCAFFGALAVALCLNGLMERISFLSQIRRVLLLVCFASIAPGVFLVFMAHHGSFQDAVNILIEPFVMAKQMGFANVGFYKRISGFDDPHGNVFLMFESAAGYLVISLFLGSVSHLISRLKDRRKQLLLVLFFAFIVTLIAIFVKVEMISLVFRGLPLILIVVIMIKVFRFISGFSQGKDVSYLVFSIVLSVYALILASKILLYLTPFHYGFVLAVPGALISAVILTTDAACFYRGRWFSPRIFQILSMVVILGILIVHFRWSKDYYEHMNFRVSQGLDQFFSIDRDVAMVGFEPVLINNIIQWFDKNTSLKDTLVVLPEGAMINYLSRRPSPLKECEFAPSVVNLLGEETIIDELKITAPAYIVLIYRDMSEHGAQIFGVDYGQRIRQWISSHYESVFIWGEEPSKDNNYTHVPKAFLMRKIRFPV